MFKWKKASLLVLSFVLALGLVACGNSNDKTSDSKNNTETTERVLTDAIGNKVTIPSNPERIIASYSEDPLLALGVTPVAQWSVANGIQDYLAGYLKDVPTISHDLPFEEVTSFSPDLVIVESSSLVEGKYDQYAKIAPTYVLNGETTANWREELLKIGEILGKTDKAKQVLADYDKKAADAKEEIHAAIGDESAAVIWLVGNQFYIVSDNASSGTVIYNDLGIAEPNVVKEISETATSDWSSISLESLAELDADHIFLVNSDKGTGSEMLQETTWKNIPAVQKGNIYEFEASSSWLYSGPIANSQIIDDVVESLTK